jgi:1-acyl-sn-glycerol-3-phosphate acyltransferase
MDRKSHRIGAVAVFPFLFLWLLASTAAYGTACVAAGIFSRKFAQGIGRAWCRHLLCLIGVRVRVTGVEKLVRSACYAFFANHQSALDIPVLYAGLPYPLCFIAKKELFRIPFFGWGIAAMGHVRIDRSSARKARDSFIRGVERCKKHSFSLVLFPEGTRSVDGTLGEFKQGSFTLAREAGIKVVPVALRLARERLPKKGLLVRPGPVDLVIGDPLDPAGMDKRELSLNVRGCIEKMVNSASDSYSPEQTPAV